MEHPGVPGCREDGHEGGKAPSPPRREDGLARRCEFNHKTHPAPRRRSGAANHVDKEVNGRC